MNEEVKLTMSTSVGAIAAALAKAQLEMRPAVKDGSNPHFNSRFATLASCIEALKPLHDNGIAVIQPPVAHGPDGVCVTTLLLHSSGEWIRGELYMPASKRDPQGFGSALSYARRYCLTSTAGLATDDDDGETATKGSGSRGGGSRRGSSEASNAWGDRPRGPVAAVPAPFADTPEGDPWLMWALEHTKKMNDAKTAGALKSAYSSAYREAVERDAPEHIRVSLDRLKDKLKLALESKVAS